MIVAVYLPLILPVLAVPVVRWVALRLPPAVATWLVMLAAALLATCTVIALGLMVMAALSVVTVFARLGHWSPAEVWHLDAVHLPIDLAASVLLIVFLALATSRATNRIRALASAYRAAAECPDSELMVLDDERPLAHALPGNPGRIVVSTTMLASLSAAERSALLAHERAHLTRQHHLFVAVVDVLAGANPFLRPLSDVIHYTTERWADELAAGNVGDRSVVARAVGKAALASRGRPADIPPAALAATTGPVPRRVAALLAGPPVARMLSVPGVCLFIAASLILASVLASLDAADDLHHVLEIAQAFH